MVPHKGCDGAVLVVDDDDILRESLCELLELHGFHTLAARDGVEAMDRLRSRDSVRFMVLDLLMPRMNGLQVLSAVAKDEKLRELDLCVSTATVERAPVGVPLLPKPIDLARLIAMVEASFAAKA